MQRDKRTKGRVQGHSMFLIWTTVKISKMLLYNWNFFWNGQNIVDLIPSYPEPCSSWHGGTVTPVEKSYKTGVDSL